MKNVLVTGGCGFIGSNFIRYLLVNSGHRVINLDAMTYAGRGKNLEHMGFDKACNYLFVKGNITNSRRVSEVLKGENIDAVVNFAAESMVDRSNKDADPFINTNIHGTQILLQCALEQGVRRAVHISTDEVYGSDIRTPSKETDPTHPGNAYSITKRCADDFALYYFRTFGLPVCITRSCNILGPYQYPEKFIPLSVTNLREGGNIPLYGSGGNVREWLFVDDNCEGIFRVLENGKPGEIYNIGSGIRISNKDLAGRIVSEMGFGEDRIQHVDDRPGHDLGYGLDSTKIREQLEWIPKIDFVDGLKQTIKWYKENEDWWKRLKHGKK